MARRSSIAVQSVKSLLLAGGASIALAVALGVSGAAWAQDAEAEDEDAQDVIVVTGIRKSIGDSIRAKRDSTSIVEAVSAEEIGKLPDVSIAESLARLPGLALQRLNGRGQVISARGLSPDFTTTLLNGREQVSTSDNRSAEFDQYPSELINQAVVYKTPDAALIGQGLAATVDLRTVKPLDYGKRQFTINARGEINGVGKLNSDRTNKGYRVSGSYIDQFFDDTVGVAIGYAHLDSPSQSERFNAWGYATTPTGELVIGGAKPFAQTTELNRDGWVGILEWQPSERFHTSVEGYYSEFDELQTLRGIELPLFWSAAQLQPGFTAVDGFITEGAFTGVEGVVRNDANKRDNELLSLGWSAELDLTDTFSVKADIAYSDVERTDIILETNTGTGSGVGVGAADTIGFMSGRSGTTFTHMLDYSDPTLILITSSQGWGGDRFDENGDRVAVGGQVGFLNRPTVDDQLVSYRASARQEFGGGISAMEVGANYNIRDKKKAADEFFIDLVGTVDAAGNPTGVTSAPIPSNLLRDPTDLAFLGLGPMVTYNPFALIADSSLILQTRNFNADVLTKSWKVEEDIVTGWLMFDVDSQLGAIPVKGNFGTQVVYTDQSSTGFRAQGSAPNVLVDVFTDGDEYTKFYPSANLQFDMGDDVLVRLGAARTFVRPRLDQLNASQTIGRNFTFISAPFDPDNPGSTFFSGGGGNPRLEPWIADSFDLSLEKYFADGAGYFAVAGFYKHLETFIFQQSIDGFDFGTVFSRLGEPQPVNTLGRLTVWENGKGGYVRGVEVSTSIPFDVVSEALDGFGLLASYSYTTSNIEPNGPGSSSRLPGLSRHVVNATFYYEKNGYEARVSDRYRSNFLGEVAGFGNGRDFRQLESENIIDAQVGYRFQSGRLEGLHVVFQGQNLTDQEFRTIQGGDPLQVIDNQQFGRTFLFGIDYSL